MRSSVRRRIVSVVSIALLLVAGTALAQRLWSGGPRYGRARMATPDDFTGGSFLYCRGLYTSVYGEPGGSGCGPDVGPVCAVGCCREA